MELERALESFRAQGLGVAAISYDQPDVLRNFRDRMGGFHYPLLSDPDSTVIRAFGILNVNIPEDHEWYGICFPGTFIVDENGVVQAKYFEEMHRQRYTADSILIREFGVGGGTGVDVTTDHLKLHAFPAQESASRGNRVTLVVEMDLPPRMHVYAPGVTGYRPVEWAVAPDPTILAHETSFPEPEVLHLEAIQETVPVYQGKVRLMKDVTISPRLREKRLRIPMTFSYQACDDKVCYVPTKVPITLELALVPHDGNRVPEELRRKGKSGNE